MSNVIILDVSMLQPPLPMDMALDAIDKLESGQYIKMLHRMQPHPLYNILMDNGFKYKVHTGNELIEIYIWKAADKPTGFFIKDLLKGQ